MTSNGHGLERYPITTNLAFLCNELSRMHCFPKEIGTTTTASSSTSTTPEKILSKEQ
jgi:hypothetical protein